MQPHTAYALCSVGVWRQPATITQPIHTISRGRRGWKRGRAGKGTQGRFLIKLLIHFLHRQVVPDINDWKA